MASLARLSNSFLFILALLLISACATPDHHEALIARAPSQALDYCYLPAAFINPAVFARYCQKSGTCLPAGAQAGALMSSCCSDSENASGTCVGTKNSPALPGEFCENPSECATGFCDLPSHRCSGSARVDGVKICSPVGAGCRDTEDCCSLRCGVHGVCMGSPQSAMPVGGFCQMDNDECISNYCNPVRHRCE